MLIFAELILNEQGAVVDFASEGLLLELDVDHRRLRVVIVVWRHVVKEVGCVLLHIGSPDLSSILELIMMDIVSSTDKVKSRSLDLDLLIHQNWKGLVVVKYVVFDLGGDVRCRDLVMAGEVGQLRLHLFSSIPSFTYFIGYPRLPYWIKAIEIVFTALHVHCALQGRHIDVVKLVVALADVRYLVSDVATGLRCEVE